MGNHKKKDEVITLRVSSDDKKRMDDTAKEFGISRGELIRMLFDMFEKDTVSVKNELYKSRVNADVIIPLNDLRTELSQLRRKVSGGFNNLNQITKYINQSGNAPKQSDIAVERLRMSLERFNSHLDTLSKGANETWRTLK